MQAENTKLRASTFELSGGLFAAGIWTTDRNRPSELAREKPYGLMPNIEDFWQAAGAANTAYE